MFESFRISVRQLYTLGAVVGLLVFLTACGGSDESPTVTPEPVAEAPTATAEPEPTSTATSTPEPEPSPTPTIFQPAPTVAAPLYIPPTPTPTSEPEVPPEEPTAVPEVPAEDPESQGGGSAVGDLLFSSDLSDWPEVQHDEGHGYVHEGAYYIWAPLSEGQGIYVITGDTYGNDVLVSLDLQMTTSTPAANGCLITHTELTGILDKYVLCINGYGEAYAAFEWVDESGNFNADVLAQYVYVETMNPVDQVNTLTFYSYGQERVFFVNDEIVASVTHAGVPDGSVGVMVNNWDVEAAEYRFTNLNVWEVQ